MSVKACLDLPPSGEFETLSGLYETACSLSALVRAASFLIAECHPGPSQAEASIVSDLAAAAAQDFNVRFEATLLRSGHLFSIA